MKQEDRSQLDEANEIGTAILRCDMYPDSVRNPLRADFKEYIETRIAYYAVGDDEEKDQTGAYKGRRDLRQDLERVALQAQNPNNIAITAQMIPAVNAMIDIVTYQEMPVGSAEVPRLVLLCTACD